MNHQSILPCFHMIIKKICIIGSGKGSVLRQFIKHETVETVVGMEVDEMLIQLARKYLTYLMDLFDIQGSEEYFYDDELVEFIHSDIIKWFHEYHSEDVTKLPRIYTFDIIIINP